MNSTVYNSVLVPAGNKYIMTFVYTGKGKKQDDSAPPEQKKCKTQACAIQWCLARRDHKEHLCKAYIDDWKNCCEKVRAAEAARVATAADNRGESL